MTPSKPPPPMSTPPASTPPISSDEPAPETQYTVSRLTERIRILLETQIDPLWVEGEISNLKPAPSGHLYFTLKDDRAQIQAVMFRFSAQSLQFTPTNGLKVLCFGPITVYPARGNYQLKVARMRASGVGDLQLAFEQLKARLEAEGLFEASRKRPLPYLPRRIGLVTSPTGAAIRDLLTVLTRRYPGIEIVIAPVRVQGIGAKEEIATAIAQLNTHDDLDVMIVGRGGGSVEDLWAFNEEIVARAIAASRIPVVSAVGHEVDFTIADFVADVRAPTPSAAAEIVVPERASLEVEIGSLATRVERSALRRLRLATDTFVRTATRSLLRRPGQLVEEYAQRVDELCAALALQCRNHLDLKEARLATAASRLAPLSPLSTLARGYSIVTRPATGHPVTDASTVSPGEHVDVRLSRGTLHCIVDDDGPPEPGRSGPAAPRRRSQPPDPDTPGGQTRLPGF